VLRSASIHLASKYLKVFEPQAAEAIAAQNDPAKLTLKGERAPNLQGCSAAFTGWLTLKGRGRSPKPS